MVKRLGLSAQSVQARFSGSVAGKSGSSSRRRGAEEVEGEEKDDEDEEDGAGEGKDDEGSGEGDDDEDGEGEDEEAVDEGAAATETVRTLVLPLMVIGTVTLMGTTVFTLRLRFTGGARMCWRRVTARQSFALLFNLLHSSSVVSHRLLQLRLAGGGFDTRSKEGVDA